MKRRFRAGLHPLELAGWLFADLLLVLAVIGLASQIPAEPEAKPTPTKSEIRDPALNLQPIEETFSVNLSGVVSQNAVAVTDLRNKLHNSKFNSLQNSGAEAGFVMIFSGATSTSSICNGSVQTSERVFDILHKALPKLVKNTTVHKPFIRTSCAERNTVRIEVYTFK